jgi:hypothetical protein
MINIAGFVIILGTIGFYELNGYFLAVHYPLLLIGVLMMLYKIAKVSNLIERTK